MRNAMFARDRSPILMGLFFVSVAVALLMPVASARATVLKAGIADPGDPNAMYGNCGDTASGLVRKASHVLGSGKDFSLVRRIYVLDCHRFDGPGNTFVVPCPPNSNYSYCLQNQNDGLGNHILLGVITSTSQPCLLAQRRAGPPAQIDIRFFNPAFGVNSIEFRGGVSNAQIQPYAIVDDRSPIIVTATKIDQSQPASLSNVLVGIGNLTSVRCDFSF